MDVKTKFKEAKEKASEKVDDAKRGIKNWCYNHKEDLQKAGPVLLSAALIIGKNGYRDYRKSKERKEAECEFYDFRAHEWFQSKRPLTGREKLEMEEMNKAGVSKGEYLRRKRLLK